MPLPYNKKIVGTAKKLRKNPTEEEDKLWYQYLSRYPVRFLRQRIVTSYILDFYCASCKLCIEIDGSQHFTERGIGHDAARSELLQAYGITTIRFTNDQIRNEFNQVCQQIDDKVKELLKNSEPH